ncbi:MAG: ATP-binding protein [Nanoarchaeota archaeon]|nr:ATP-binding protein [Nanoarchaeota archaeon]
MVDAQKTEDLLLEARNFLGYLKKEIGKDIRSGKSVIYISFSELASFSPSLSELLISSPEQALQILEVALEESGLVQKPRVRLKEVPEGLTEKIRNLRAKHLNKLVQVEGIVRQASEVRPQVVNARFECPSCGTIISVLQTESKFREPSRCSCGRRGQFKLISKEMVDAQRLVIEESPENLTGGEQPRRISVFLREDLVEPKMEEKTTPGARIQVIGILSEIAKHSATGTQLVRYDIAIEANNIIPLEETFEDFDITEEDERQIQELAADSRVFQKLAESIAPSIYGYEEIKQAILLQMFSGVKKTKSDGNKTRGDIHILLVGDPGVAKSVNKNARILYHHGKEFGYKRIEEIHRLFGRHPKNLSVLTIDMKKHAPKWCNAKEILKHAPEKELIKISTEHGKEIIATKDHSFITLSETGEIVSIKGSEISNKTFLPLPISFHKPIISSIETERFNTHKTSSRPLPKKIELNELFGFFIGIFLSEGYIMNKEKNTSKAVVISNSNPEITSKVKEFAKSIGLKFGERKGEIRISSVSLARLLSSCCYTPEKTERKVKGNYAVLKKIPDFSYFAPKEFIYSLISGSFSGDGRFIKDKKRLKGIELVTISRELAEGMSDLLFCVDFLNIISKRKYLYHNQERQAFFVRIPFSALSRFLEKIKFYGRENLNCPIPIYSYNDMIPCGKMLYELTRKLGYNKRINGNRVLAAEMRTVRSRNEIGRIRLKNTLKEFELKNPDLEEFKILSKIVNSKIIWSKVKKIEPCLKEDFVYDLCIPETNTFIANGIGVHNSQILKFVSTIAPKGRYVVGKSTSGAGLCVSPHSLIMTNPGGMERIQDIIEKRMNIKEEYQPGIWKQDNVKGLMIQSMSDDLKIQSKKPDFIWKLKAPEEVFEVALSSGKKIELTGNTQLFCISNGKTYWKKSSEIKEGEYLATPRKLIGGNVDNLHSLDLIDSNPVIHNIKLHVKRISGRLAKKYRSLREAAKKLNISEDNLYYNWVNEKARGNIKLNELKKICFETGENYRDFVSEVSLYNGKNHAIPKVLTKEVFYLAGMIAGDGDIRKAGKNNNTFSIRLSNSNEKIHETFRKTLEKEFSLKYDIQKGNEKRPETTRTNSKILAEILFKLGICESPKSNKIMLSEQLLHMSNEMLGEYIAGLYDCDGSVCIRKTRGSNCIDFTTCSEKLARQLQLALLRYEIRSILRKRKPSEGKIKGRYDKWVLEIRGLENFKKFKENIFLKHPLKKEKLCVLAGKEKQGTNTDIVPGIGAILKEILQKRGISLRESGWHKNLSRKGLQRILEKEKIDEPELAKLAYNDIFWERVKEVRKKKAEYEFVYDLTVENSHNFIVDGILVHNTATVVRDEYLKGWSLEAGAMVLSNHGLICIDELEKMDPNDRSAMHEALEQQSVTISKANIQASLRAETTVLAAGNPKFGRFDPYQTVASQIDIPPTLINRFDVVFIMKDIPDRARDEAIASHVLMENTEQRVAPIIDRDLFRKYIAYAKQKIHPKLTEPAIEEIKKFYVDLRNAQVSGEIQTRPLPISARQLDALIRMSEASAKSRLSQQVSRDDAKRGINLMKYYLMQVGYDYETKTFDIDRIATGVSTSQRGKIMLVKDTLNKLESRLGKLIPIEELRKELEGKIDGKDLEDSLDKLTISGDIFHPRKGFVQRM